MFRFRISGVCLKGRPKTVTKYFDAQNVALELKPSSQISTVSPFRVRNNEQG